MPNNKKDNLFYSQLKSVVQDSIDGNENFNLNPTMSRLGSFTQNSQSRIGPNTTSRDYAWAWRSFDYSSPDTNVRLHKDILLEATNPIAFKSQISSNGNLTIFGVEPNKIHAYSASVFSARGGNTRFRVPWSGDVALYANQFVLASNFTNTDITTQDIAVPLETGWNDIDIFLFTRESNRYFTINNELGEFADDWNSPAYDSPDTPVNIGISIDDDPTSKRDTNNNIIKWDETPPLTTWGYNIYRRGPYNTGIASPVIIPSGSFPTYLSGAGGQSISGFFMPATYTVSAEDSNGESLAQSTIQLEIEDKFFGVPLVTGYSATTGGATLATGLYDYVVMSKANTGDKWPQNTILQVNNTSNSVQLGWLPDINVTGYEIWRTDNPFDPYFSGFAGVLITGLGPAVTGFLDTGYVGGPLVTGMFPAPDNDILPLQISYPGAIVHNAYQVNWSGVTSPIGDTPTYRVYKTFYSGNYSDTSLIAITTGLSIIDSGFFGHQYDTPFVSGTAPILGSPVGYERVSSTSFGVNEYVDVGVKAKRKYDYRVTSFNYSNSESPYSSGVTVIAGDTTPPLLPSGVSTTVADAFINLNWQVGTEPDLAGTKIYEASTLLGTYSLVGETASTTFTKYVGYNTARYYKLLTFDLNDNDSALTSAVSGVTGSQPSISGSGGSGISAVVDDLTPQLGGNLDLNGKAISGVTATFETSSTADFTFGGAVDFDSAGRIDFYSNDVIELTAGWLATSPKNFNIFNTSPTGVIQIRSSHDDGIVNIGAGTIVVGDAAGNGTDVVRVKNDLGTELQISGSNIYTTGTILPMVSGVDDIGSPTKYYNNLYVNNIETDSIVAGSSNYAVAYDTTVQSIAVASTPQALTYDTNSVLDNITHTATSSGFVVQEDGTYSVSFMLHVERSAGVTADVEAFVAVDGTEVGGSQAGVTVDIVNRIFNINNTWPVVVTSGQEVTVQWAASTSTVSLGTVGGVASTLPTTNISIHKV